jgi:site-specific DNA-methyltransferase (adenine-specific)
VTEAFTNTIRIGDALEQLRRLPDGSVNCVITSPPWFGHRDYGVAGQIGREATVEQWVERMRPIMAEIYRILRDDGSAWIDLGDSYARDRRTGVPAKSLHLAPERFALAMVADSWTIRSRLIWHKSNPMPDSVTDRLSNTYDIVWHLVKRPKYFYDLDSIRVVHASSGLLSKNPGDLWSIPIAHFRGAHFATFNPKVVERPLLATCPLRVCLMCDQPWRREPGRIVTIGKRGPAGQDRLVRRYATSWRTLRQPGPLVPDCDCDAPTRPGIVLDPFFGTGTVGVVAERHGRSWVGIELSEAYAELAWQRLGRDGPPLAEAA